MHDPLPILCHACGAPADTMTDDIVVLRCAHCGAEAELPRESHARVRELRRRIQARAAGVVQLSARDVTFARIFEGDGKRTVVLPYVLIGLFALVTQFGQFAGGPSRGVSAYAICMSLIGMLPVLGFPLAALVGLALGRRIYRAEIRDLLLAYPSRVPGGPARCRCCAAELPHEHGPLLRCRYCNTHSLVTPALQARSVEALAVEDQVHRTRLALAGSRVIAVGRTMDRVLYLAMPVSYVAVVVLGKLAESLLMPR